MDRPEKELHQRQSAQHQYEGLTVGVSLRIEEWVLKSVLVLKYHERFVPQVPCYI
jgi:hypothetical protein